jgi:hypothetical protein
MPAVDILQRILGHEADKSEGLHFAVFLPRAPDLPGNPQAVNQAALETMIRVHGWGDRHTVEEQVRLWKERIPEIGQSFRALDSAAQAEQPERRLTRLVVDVEVGGVLYAAIEDHGWVFAATLSQQAMNNGRAERQLVEIIHRLGDWLRGSGPTVQ